jgi:hypothetical protein
MSSHIAARETLCDPFLRNGNENTGCFARHGWSESRAESRIGEGKTQDQSCTHVDIEKLLVTQCLEELDCRILRQREQPAVSDYHQPSHEGDDDGQRALDQILWPITMAGPAARPQAAFWRH